MTFEVQRKKASVGIPVVAGNLGGRALEAVISISETVIPRTVFPGQEGHLDPGQPAGRCTVLGYTHCPGECGRQQRHGKYHARCGDSAVVPDSDHTCLS